MRFSVGVSLKLAAMLLPLALLGLAIVKVAKPRQPAFAPAGAHMLAVLRDEHEMLSDQLKRDTAAAQFAAEEDAAQFRLAEQEQELARTKLAAAALTRITPKTVAVEPPRTTRQHTAAATKMPLRDERQAGEPLQLATVNMPVESAPKRGFLKHQVDQVVDAAGQIPVLVRDASGWISRSMPSLRLPDLPRIPVREFLKAEM